MRQRAAILLAALMLFGMVSALSACKAEESPQEPVDIQAAKASIVVRGYEWGPAIPKVVIEFPSEVTGLDNSTFEVKFGSTKRTVTGVYASDAAGESVSAASKYVTVEMSVKYNESSPFTYSGANIWTESIPFTVTVAAGKSFTVGDTTYREGDKLSYKATAADRLVPQTASWVKDTVDYKEEGKDITLTRAAWAPQGAESDAGKNPLIIWLHGAGEGGTDIDIDLLGNEVTALTAENETNVQKYFATNGLAGAYVLAVQTPTIWMDSDGNGTYNHKDTSTTEKQESWYTGALWKAITTYVESNPDVDTGRIYLGGCSNGGYMTMNMMFEHGDYFAAFYPICEAYLDQRISDEMIESIKDRNIWFLLSADDGTVTPSEYALPTYVRLLKAGAKNVWLTVMDKVRGTDDPNPKSWTGSGFYDGHWSWIYAFNDQVTTRFDPAQASSVEDLTPDNCTVTGVNLWQWLSEQKLP